MSSTTIQHNRSDFHPDSYEGSYKNIFTFLNFNFSVLKEPNSTKKVGRPKFPKHALFGALVLKFLALNASYRTVEAMLNNDGELASLMAFAKNNIPSDSTLNQFFAKLTLKDIYTINSELIKRLQAHGYVWGNFIALDSTPIESFCRHPTKTNPETKDPEVKWGYAKCKNGAYYGYKAQVIVYIEDYLPLYFITTAANVSDQKMVAPFLIHSKI
ncbi:MAG: transposase [Candidatus Lokiarchaeota archaeon]|nr:transposase [Candidatus Lokiarchaeota archaeon]